MAYTTIDKPSDYFNTVTYVANQTDDRQITVGFQPDWTWLKDRDQAVNHDLYDSVRGATKYISSNKTNAEGTQTDGLKSFNSTGFTLGTGWGNQTTGDDYVAWNWKAGTSFTNDASATGIGSIDSAGSVNTDAGFSIVKYDSSRSPSAVQTVAHGLGVKPDMLIFKNLNESQNWLVWNKTLATNKHLNLNTTSALSTDAGSLNNTAPTSSVFTIGADGRTNSTTNGNPIICYAFAEKKGYSKFGSYTGNGNANGTFVYLGFKPAFFMIKRTDGSGDKWRMWDNKRSPFNVVDDSLACDETSAEYDDVSVSLDFLSNGCKMKMSGGGAGNGSGETYIFMAFAENPFVSSTGVAACAR